MKGIPAKVFSREFCEIFQNNFYPYKWLLLAEEIYVFTSYLFQFDDRFTNNDIDK